MKFDQDAEILEAPRPQTKDKYSYPKDQTLFGIQLPIGLLSKFLQ